MSSKTLRPSLATSWGTLMLLAVGAVIISGCDGKPLKMPDGNTHTIVLHIGKKECFAAPQVTHANPGDHLVFFVADTNSTAIVSGLNDLPLPKGTSLDRSHVDDRDRSGSRFSDIDSLPLELGHYDRVRISPDAKGIYELKVECGGKTDDPPKVVVW